MLDHDVHAPLVRDPPHLGLEIHLLIVDEDVGAQVARFIQLLLATGSGKDAGASLFRDLDGSASNAAPRRPGPAWRPSAGPEPEAEIIAGTPAGGAPVRVAISAGPAFSFFYEENLELLRAAGAELCPFDPISDEELPARAAALLLTGGFPEVYGEQLSANWALRAEIAAFARAGRPVLAECGGLLYLVAELDGRPMCGVIEATARMTDRLALGYREAIASGEHPAWERGAQLRGHEFHYSRLDRPAGERPAWLVRGRAGTRAEGHVVDAVHASYLHTHWAATPSVAAKLLAAASSAPEVAVS